MKKANSRPIVHTVECEIDLGDFGDKPCYLYGLVTHDGDYVDTELHKVEVFTGKSFEDFTYLLTNKLDIQRLESEIEEDYLDVLDAIKRGADSRDRKFDQYIDDLKVKKGVV